MIADIDVQAYRLWLITPDDGYRDLHAAAGPIVEATVDGVRVDQAADLLCGRDQVPVILPGLTDRTMTNRCVGCCEAVGILPGVGSPIHDRAVRQALDLHPDDGSSW